MFAAEKTPCGAIYTTLEASESKFLCNVRVNREQMFVDGKTTIGVDDYA